MITCGFEAGHGKPKIVSYIMVLAAFTLAGTVRDTPAYAQIIDVNWSQDGSRFWFVERDRKDRTFYIVDTESKSRQLAFDHDKVAASLTKILDKPIDANRLPIRGIEFGESEQSIDLVGSSVRWTLNLESYGITESDAKNDQPIESDLFLPPRNSRRSDDVTDIVFVNELEQSVEMFWLATNGRRSSYGVIAAGQTKTLSTYVGHMWLVIAGGKVLGCHETQPDGTLLISLETVAAVRTQPKRKPRSRSNRRNVSDLESPDKSWNAFLRDHDLWIRKTNQTDANDQKSNRREAAKRSNSTEIPLAEDANEKNTFLSVGRTYLRPPDGRPNVRWSPDSRHLIAFQTLDVDVPRVHYIESSPADQLQPILRSYSYPKPGDPMPTRTLRLFSLAQGAGDAEDVKEIEVSNELFGTAYSLRFLQWSESGDRFWLLYNQRGHQVLRVIEVSVADGSARTIAENTSETFVHYSDRDKSFHQFQPNDELLWCSESSGWNHLYRYDLLSGKLTNPVTSGNWNVKRVVEVDNDQGRIWFYAVGVVPNQDPYHEHFCRVDFDGSNFKVLTDGDGTHEIQFEQDRQYFIDRYSRVDMAPVVELRDSESGELICELQRDDAADDFQNRRLTERFVAPGRDGKTEIWGIIHFPKNFDAEKKYPVVENIYAGPHDHHVHKAYRKRYGHQYQVADAGSIVVQIDGMGTAWRSKAFHDVCYKNLKDGGFPDRIAWIKAAAEKFPQMDTSRVGIYGGSAGGQNAMAALLWHNDFYSVAVSDCGCHDNRMDKRWWNEQWMGYPVDDSYIKNSNMENAHLMKGNLMLLVGEKDENVDPATTTQVVRKLIEANKDFEFGAGRRRRTRIS